MDAMDPLYISAVRDAGYTGDITLAWLPIYTLSFMQWLVDHWDTCGAWFWRVTNPDDASIDSAVYYRDNLALDHI